MTKKKVLLLATSCKSGGLCPGGIDWYEPDKWIRIVADDDKAGSVQGKDIAHAKPLEVIEFDGTPRPIGIQKENWVINYNSCKVVARYSSHQTKEVLEWVAKHYGYNGFWGNDRPYLTQNEFDAVCEPTESVLMVSAVKIYRNSYKSTKIDFTWDNGTRSVRGASVTDNDFYDRTLNGSTVELEHACIVVSIPKYADDWVHPETGEPRAYKFVSKVFDVS
ncbi:MAG: hypothetical protein LBG97_04140 [Coriobacteriales bacterium]|jgi:hypothetical protein|nr:hypothetical protein [Coriobacteriales bacterium]